MQNTGKKQENSYRINSESGRLIGIIIKIPDRNYYNKIYTVKVFLASESKNPHSLKSRIMIHLFTL